MGIIGLDDRSKRSRIDILIVGKGGDGVASFADILGLAATLDNKFSSTRSTYGASQRGEAIFSEIILSKKPVQYPFVEDPDFYIALSHQGFFAYHNKITPQKDPIIFIESTFDYDLGDVDENLTVIKLSTMQCALDNGLGLNNANIVMLGSFIELTSLISKDALKDAISKKISKRYLKEDLKALQLGYKLGNSIKHEISQP